VIGWDNIFSRSALEHAKDEITFGNNHTRRIGFGSGHFRRKVRSYTSIPRTRTWMCCVVSLVSNVYICWIGNSKTQCRSASWTVLVIQSFGGKKREDNETWKTTQKKASADRDHNIIFFVVSSFSSIITLVIGTVHQRPAGGAANLCLWNTTSA